MSTASELPGSVQADAIARLQRIEGQVRGIQKMIESDRDCVHIIDQLAAVKAAINVLNASMFESVALNCIRHPDSYESPEVAIEKMVKMLVRAGK